jgi:peptidoglycan/xylan/chitin deacetylase (PgdA/CDA1 family)
MNKYAIFTMDVEDFSDIYCLRKRKKQTFPSMMDGLENYLALLEKYHIKADLFVLADRLKKDEVYLRDAVKRGHTIALHGYSHELPSNETIDVFKQHIIEAKTLLEKTFNVTIQGFRAPGFSLRQDEADLLPKLGFCYDCSEQDYKLTTYGADLDTTTYQEVYENVLAKDGFYEVKMPKSIGHPLHGMPIGGGGYLRMPPYHFVKRVIAKTVAKKNLYVFYCHPFECSKLKTPYVGPLGPLNTLYLNRRKNYLKHIEDIIQLLQKEGYTFVTYEELLAKIA